MKYLSLYIIFSFLLSAPRLLVLYPDADLSNNTDKLNASDIETVYYLFVDGFRQYSEFDIIEQDERHVCQSKECAMSVGDMYNADQVVTSTIRVLGTKIIFTGMIFDGDGDNTFTSRITAINVEDMENAAMRLSKSLINKNTIDEAADVDNIVESDAEEDVRRESLYKVGISLGYLLPFGGNGYEYIDDNDTPDDYSDDYMKRKKSVLQLGLLNYWEFKDNKSLLLDVYFQEVGFGLDLSYNKFINREDFSPFYGAGIGWHMNSNPNLEDHIDNNDPMTFKHGIAPSVNAGFVLFRTYNTNVICRLKYHMLFPNEGDIDHGIALNVSLVRKLTPNQSLGSRRTNETVIVNRYPIIEVLLDVLLNK